MIKASERLVYGFADQRGIIAVGVETWLERVARLHNLGVTIFRAEADHRGYCMALWDEDHK